jgi:phi13 family phage major tail protein
MNKVKFGLKNVHYSVITDTAGVITFGTPVKMPGAVNLLLNPKGDKVEFYADDMAYFVATANQGYEGDLEVALIPDQFKIDVLGEKADANGVLFEDSAAIPKNIALMYEFTGDAKATRHVNYNVSVARPSIEGKTKTSSIEPATDKIAITASPATDTGYVKAKAQVGDTGYDTFYTSVYAFVPVA